MTHSMTLCPLGLFVVTLYIEWFKIASKHSFFLNSNKVCHKETLFKGFVLMVFRKSV